MDLGSPATGAQIWALRNILREEPETTLTKLGTAGYTLVEPAGFNVDERTMQGFKPEVLKKLTAAQGLKLVSGHFQVNTEDMGLACEAAASMGMKYVVRSFFSNELEQTPDAYKRAADALNHMGATAAMHGLQLAYHNHAHEFELVDGIVLFDILLDHTDRELVVFQPDLGWLGYAGRDPQFFFEKHPDRFPLWHLRDIDALTKKSTAIGQGMIDFSPAFSSQGLAGLQYAIVEMASDAEDPLGKILSSRRVLDRWL